MQVLKFGGTSVANAENMSKVCDIVVKAAENDRTIVVASAISKCTDTLIKIGKLAAEKDESYKQLIADLQERHNEIILNLVPAERREKALKVCDAEFDTLRGIATGVCLLGELSQSSLDAIQGLGELFSTRILAAKLASLGLSVLWTDSRKLIRTVNNGEKNVVDYETSYANILAHVESCPSANVIVAPGFIASDEAGRMTTLGRGGSDYSASIYAVGCNARSLEIWTDVPGMMTADPRIVPTARPIRHISYRAALELSHFGAKVIYPPTIQPVVAQGIPIYVKDTFNPEEEGTMIEKNPPRGNGKLIGISNSDKIALLSLEGSGMVGVPGFSSRLFDALSRSGINIILITQASSVHTMCIAVADCDAQRAKEAADSCFAYEISLGKLNPLRIETGYSILCLVGDDILNQSGSTGLVLAALGRNGIPVRATAQGSSERNISVIVRSEDANTAIRHMHNEFFDRLPYRTLNLFIAGYGTVGSALIKLIRENKDEILYRTGKLINVVAISNSRRFVCNRYGIDLGNVGELLKNGQDASQEEFFTQLATLHYENSVFVDCTASAEVSYRYTTLIRQGYGIVACNKIAFGSDYARYAKLKQVAHECGQAVHYETTVGAALPVIESVDRCVYSGDSIHSVSAVLSGTLNYIFSTYNGADGVTFAEVVKAAQDAGYTEPDPRLDLSGKDVLRKLLIISREAGIKLDECDVKINNLLSDEFFKGDVADFYKALADNESYFKDLADKASANGCVLRFVASLKRREDGSYVAKTGLEHVAPDNPLYNLKGSDNACLITSDFYPEGHPLVIQGAGAGGRQTASGVLNDILMF